MSGDGVHSGVAVPQASSVDEVVPENSAALEEGRANLMGTSASGAHKSLPSSKHPASQEGVKSPRGSKYHERTGDAALEEGKSKESFRQAYK